MNKVKLLRFGEFFSGPGGLSLGAIRSKISDKSGVKHGFIHTWANDFDQDSCKTYRTNICNNPNDPSVICEDVKKINIDNLSPIDVFAYGFPCNDFSLVGEQKGFKGNYGALYTYGVKVLNKFQPIAFVAENVNGLSSANGGLAFKQILNDLSKAGPGYKITANLYKAEEYGVPQTRHRIIIVGISTKLAKNFRVPSPTHKNKFVSSREALKDIPLDAPNNEIPKSSARVVERLTHIKPGQNVWNAELPEHLKINVKNTKLSQIYKRLNPDLPSYTLTGSGGGGTHGYHFEYPRPLTNRERARIQTFPDDYQFIGGYNSVRKQIGMAVPPKLSDVIFTSLLKTLNDIEYSWVKPNIDIENIFQTSIFNELT